MTVTQDANGWTVVSVPPGDVYYVSTSGDNGDDGSISTPFETLAYAKTQMASGDWLLLKRGDTFTGENFGNGGIPEGIDSDNPTFIGTYGTGGRPQILTGTSKLFNYTTTNFRNVVFIGLYFTPHTRADDTSDLAGIELNANITNLIIEDCYIAEYQFGLILQGSGSGVQVRRNIIVDCYEELGSGDASGMFSNGLSGLLVEENVFDHNGWKSGVTVQNARCHNLYLSSGSTNTTLAGNMFSRSSGACFKTNQLNGVIDCSDNCFVANGYMTGIGTSAEGPNPSGIVVTFEDNVICNGQAQDSYGDGSYVSFQNIESGSVARNLICNNDDGAGMDRSFFLSDDDGGDNPGNAYGVHDLTIEDNVQYNYWGPMRIYKPSTATITGVVIQNNHFIEPNLDQNDDPHSLVVLDDPATADGVTFSANTYYRGGDGTEMFEPEWNTTWINFSTWQSTYENDAANTLPSYTAPTREWDSYCSGHSLTDADGGYTALRASTEPGELDRISTVQDFHNWIRLGFDMGVPALSAATVQSAGTTLVLDFDEAVSGTEEDGWSITSDASAVTATGGSGSGTAQLTLTLSRTVNSDETLTLDYASSTGDLADTSANDLEDIADFDITNSSAQGTPLAIAAGCLSLR